MEDALRDNDRYNWKPQAPVFLHHGTHDDIVPFFCTQMAYEAMRKPRALASNCIPTWAGPLSAGQHLRHPNPRRLRKVLIPEA